MNLHDIHDESGQKIGHLSIIPRDEGRHLHVAWVGSSDRPSGTPNTIGPEAMRSVVSGLRAHYPVAQFLSGNRVSGFRTGQPEKVVIPLRG